MIWAEVMSTQSRFFFFFQNLVCVWIEIKKIKIILLFSLFFLLFMDFTRFFGTIYEPYCTILINFYFYL